MANNINDEILIDKIEEYVKENGWPGFFGLLATITPHKIDQEDLKKYNESTIKSKKMVEQTQTEKNIPLAFVEKVQDASIYAEEHIPAVQEDLREQGLTGQAEVTEVKTKVLEPPKSSAPNPWGEAKVVSPGELNLQ